MCAEKSECSKNYTCAGDIIKGERQSEGGVETASVWVKESLAGWGKWEDRASPTLSMSLARWRVGS